MTGTVIDSLIVELGLDPRKFTEGQREALASFKRTQEEAEKGAKNAEDSSRRVSVSVANVRAAAVQMFAAFSGGKGLIDFVSGLTASNAELGRLQRSTGASASEINKWQGVARIFGGDAKSMASSFVSISDAFAGWKVGVVSPLIADLRAISTAGGTIIDVNKGVNESLLDLAANLKVIHDKDPAQAGFLGRKIGLDPALLDVLLTGREGVQKVLDLVTKVGVATDKDIDSFGELEKRIGNMGNKAESIGRQLFGGENGGAAQVAQTADFVNLTPAQAWDAASKQFQQEYQKSGFFGAWWNLLSGSATIKTQPLVGNTGTGSGAFASQAEKEAFIRAEAQKRGIDPNIAMAVAKSEGFKDYVGDKGTSFGAFQLHYKNNIPGLSNAGLGDEFTKRTGKHASDPATEREQIQFALDQAKQGGWAPWHGWKGSRFAGIGQGGGSMTNETNINGPITINAGPNADGTKIAQDFRAELQRRQGAAAQANDGQN